MSLIELNLNITRINDNHQLPTYARISDWLALAYFGEKPCTINIEIVDKALARSLNLQYREKDYATNVLSFPFEAPPIEMPIEHLGDLVLCADVVDTEAQQQKVSVENHWAHLLIHGILHLQGYDHIEDNEAQAMESLEIKILEKLNIKNPYLISNYE
ncbi:MAG: rRNA maturation RNase YbeY [Thiotrichaceae bacterium]|nr:rRNA maturation RNase YbeY [Thiotrichaceae bacterium]